MQEIRLVSLSILVTHPSSHSVRIHSKQECAIDETQSRSETTETDENQSYDVVMQSEASRWNSSQESDDYASHDCQSEILWKIACGTNDSDLIDRDDQHHDDDDNQSSETSRLRGNVRSN